MNNKAVRIALHILGCLVVLSIPLLFSPDFGLGINLFSVPPFQKDFLFHVVLLLFFYLTYFILIPQFFFQKKRLAFFGILIGSLVLIEWIQYLIFPSPGSIALNMHHNVFKFPAGDFPHPPHFREYVNNVIEFLCVIIFSLLIKINEQWKMAEKERLSTELSYLKAQINPHFLFNTLNSIYSLAITKSDETAEAVVKLSEMMRYVTTESENDFVSLEKEVSYIKNYIDLQKLRLGDTVDVKFSMEGLPKFKLITPLLLIPFVENAFKYGVNPEEESFIVIHIAIRENELEMEVTNKKVRIDFSKESHSGHGIENVRRRLDFTYPGKHTLTIKDEPARYFVSLKLVL